MPTSSRTEPHIFFFFFYTRLFAMMSAVWYLEHVDMYELLCPHKFAEYAAQHTFRRVGKDSVIYFAGEAASTVYLIASGKVKIASMPLPNTNTLDRDRQEADECVKAILGKGELFGEMALLGETIRTDLAIALEDTMLCPMSVEIMQGLMRDYKHFALVIQKLIGWKIRKIERRMELLLFRDARTRLIEFIRDIAAENAIHLIDAVRVRHIYTQQNIADLLGIARPTVNILLQELRNEGALDFKRGEFLIKNRAMFGI